MQGLVHSSEDASDYNSPLMLWYASEPLAQIDADRALKLAEKAKMPNLFSYMIRRVGEINTPAAKKYLEAAKERLSQKNNGDGTDNQKLIDSLLTK